MGGSNAKLTTASKGPTVVMMVGLQGAGKTTNGAKLAGLMRRQFGRRPLLVACDVYRPAAIDQLVVLAKELGMKRTNVDNIYSRVNKEFKKAAKEWYCKVNRIKQPLLAKAV